MGCAHIIAYTLYSCIAGCKECRKLGISFGESKKSFRKLSSRAVPEVKSTVSHALGENYHQRADNRLTVDFSHKGKAIKMANTEI